MSGQESYNHDDVIMAKFARALGLPVRIFIIRVIINQHNSAAKEDFANAVFTAELLNKHILQLKGLGILKIRTEKRKSTYSVDKDFFSAMSEKFSSLFNSLENKRDNIAPISDLKFNTDLKTQKLSFHISPEEFAARLSLDKSI